MVFIQHKIDTIIIQTFCPSGKFFYARGHAAFVAVTVTLRHLSSGCPWVVSVQFSAPAPTAYMLVADNPAADNADFTASARCLDNCAFRLSEPVVSVFPTIFIQYASWPANCALKSVTKSCNVCWAALVKFALPNANRFCAGNVIGSVSSTGCFITH